jgi:pyrophosphatase PpaX
LLDVDGTLLDTREFIYAAFEHTIAHHRLPPLTRAQMQHQMGLPLEAIYGWMGEDDVLPLIETHRSFQAANLALSAPFEGAAEALARLRAAGLKMAAVTSRSSRTSVLTLERAGLAQYFDAVVSAEDGGGLKPDPAPLRHALAMLCRGTAGAAMVGDSPHDIEAGKALGLFTIAATYGFHESAVVEARPDIAISRVSELPAALLAGSNA